MSTSRRVARRRLNRLGLVLALISGLIVVLPSSAEASPGTGGPIMLAENTAKCVDLDVASGRVQVYDCLGDTNQQWTLNGDGSLTASGACLETPPAQTGNNTRLVAAACTGTENQKWTHDGQELVNAAADRCIDLPNGDQANQSQLQVYDCLDNPNQQWVLPANAAGWTAAWGSAMQQAPMLTNSANLTCRDTARITVSGTAVRIRLSNAFVSEPVTFNAVSVAVRDTGGSIVAGTALPVTFNGSSSVTVAAGGEVLSDGVSMLVSAGEDLAVSTYIAGPAAAFPNHANGVITHYCTPLDGSGGNHVDDVSAAAFTGIASNVAWLSGIDVAGGSGAVVALGDSITDGVTATVDGFTRYTDDLQRRLQAAGSNLGVINEGISGDGITESYSVPNAPDRLGRDVLDLSNVSAVTILLGTNDIGLGQSAQPIINGLTDLANRVHAAGVRVIAGTLLPRWCGWPANVDATQAESIREQVNTFIRTSSEFDAVADFDAALRNTNPNYFPTPESGLPCASNPNYDQYLAPAYDSDHTHPSNAGYAAMANTIDLATLLPAGGPATTEITWHSTSKCVDRDVASGRVQIWDCLGGSNQLWTLNSDATLTTGGVCAETPDGTAADVAPCTAASNQLWTRSGSSLVNQATGSCLDLSGGDSTNGRQLVLATCDGGPDQSFAGPG